MTKEPDQKDIHAHRNQKLFSILIVVIFVLFCGAVGYFIGRPMLQFVADPEQFRQWVDSSGFLGCLLFVGMVVLQVIVALIPGEPLEIGAGYAFGFLEGTLLCMVGVVLGSFLVFAMTRKWGMRIVSLFFSVEKIQSVKFLQDSQRLHMLIFFLFFIPGTPKDLLTYMAGLTPISMKSYLLIANIARLPSVITSIVGGNALGEQNYLFAIVTFAVVAVISVVGLLIYKRFTDKKKKADREPETEIETDNFDSPCEKDGEE